MRLIGVIVIPKDVENLLHIQKEGGCERNRDQRGLNHYFFGQAV